MSGSIELPEVTGLGTFFFRGDAELLELSGSIELPELQLSGSIELPELLELSGSIELLE